MTLRETVTRMSASQWPPTPQSVLKFVLGAFFAALCSLTAWLLISQVASQVLQAQNADAIQVAQTAVTVVAKDVDELGQHDEKIDQAIHGINLTSQRLSDMIARHDADLHDIKDDLKDERRSRRSPR